MKNIKDFEVKDKKVIVRVNFDVPLDERGKILDDFRIIKSLPTIKYLLDGGAKVILISHLGRPSPSQKQSLKPTAQNLSELIKKEVKFIPDCIGKQVERAAQNLKSGEIILLENLRFYLEEQTNDDAFAKKLASLGEIYINDAFSDCHREHASMVGIPKYLPKGAGLLLEEEVKVLSAVMKNPKRPLTVILGGAKIETKLPCLMKFLNIADHIAIGGKLAPEILSAKGIAMSNLPLEKEIEKELIKVELTNPKLHMPVDALAGLENHQEDYLRQSAVGKIRREERMFDIGPETVRIFCDIIQESKTVLWNGPLGYVEDERFAGGSLAIASAILRSQAFSIVGGGETNAFLAQNNLRDKFGFVSTGGGAMLEFLSDKELPGIKALE